MLRSFDYAAHQLALTGHADAQHVYRAGEWARPQPGCVLRRDTPRWPAAIRGTPVRCSRAFELDKAVYEVGYEHGHRPAWVQIPMGAIAELVKEQR